MCLIIKVGQIPQWADQLCQSRSAGGHRPTLPIQSPKRLGNPRRRSAGGRAGRSSSAPGSSSAGGVSSSIRVAVRVRPENSREKAGAYNNVINVVDDKMLIFDPKQEGENDFYFQGKKQGRRDLNKKENKDQKFAYDSVYAPGSTNDQVFEGTTKDLVEVIFNGYNCSVFAYGATGAGKTFTMLGSKVEKKREIKMYITLIHLGLSRHYFPDNAGNLQEN